MVYFDSHLHFDTFIEKEEVAPLMERALDTQVTRMVAIGGSDEANERALTMVEHYPDHIRATAGFDRDMAGKPIDERLLRDYLCKDSVVAIGETGLDYHYSKDTAKEQQLLFERHLELALSFQKPVVIHNRESDEDMLSLLRDYVKSWKGSGAPAVLHCFTGNKIMAKKLLDLGLMISFSGIVTFKSATEIQEAAQYVPEDRLLIETDAPYLAPVPHRGKINEPAKVVHVAEQLASLRNCTLEEIAQCTFTNASRFFNWTSL